jgi:type II secretory pathway pseudopilin PulG
MKFTLVEVVVALTVLGLAIISASAMCSQSINRITKAKARWVNQHMLSQAAEYFLLVGANTPMSTEIFPYRNVQVNCTVVNAEGLPPEVDAVSGQWRLATYEISLSGASGEKLHSLKIDKIIQVSD